MDGCRFRNLLSLNLFLLSGYGLLPSARIIVLVTLFQSRPNTHGFTWLKLPVWVYRLVVVLAIVWSASIGWAQPPGTEPPNHIFEKQSQEELPVRGFIFLNDSGNPVLRPGTTWEEFEQVMDQITGRRADGNRYVYRSLKIKGDASTARATFDIELELDVESTAGIWTTVPLQLSTFRLTKDAVVRGPGEHRVFVDRENGGYQLQVRCDQRSTFLISMTAVAQVNRVGRQILEMNLPPVPTHVELRLSDEMTAQELDGVEVTGRGDEVVQRSLEPYPNVIVESNGVSQSIRWGDTVAAKSNFDLIEVDSDLSVRWDSPQDQPIATVDMSIRNLRGSVEKFYLRLPPGAIALDLPRLGRDGLRLDWEPEKPESAAETPTTATSDSASENETPDNDDRDFENGQWFLITIPEQERQQKISFSFEMQLAGSANVNEPLSFQVPQIWSAIRHSGDFAITTGGDYRLRWQREPFVRRLPLVETVSSSASQRVDRFHFDRQAFALPIWLADQQQEILLNTAATITIRNGLADMEMQVRLTGRPAEGRIRMNDAGWEILSISNGSNDQPLESFRSDAIRTIEVGEDTAGGSLTIRISGQRPLANDWGQIAIPIPSVTLDDDDAATGQATLDIVGAGRTRLVVDLTATEGLTRVGSGGGPNALVQETSRFRINARQSPAVIIGDLVDQPPRLSMVANATIELDGSNLKTLVTWNARSPMDLEGRLPIRFSKKISEQNSADVKDEIVDPILETSVDQWSVTIDGVPAVIRQVKGDEDDEFEIVSERLSSGTFAIELRHQKTIELVDSNQQNLDPTVQLDLPRPSIADITLDQPLNISLIGNDRFKMAASGEYRPGELQLDRFPLESVQLRVRPRTTRLRELSMSNVVLRTIVGSQMRHEQLVAEVMGGNQIRIGYENPWLSEVSDVDSSSNSDLSTIDGLSLEATLDGMPIDVTMDKRGLSADLPGDAQTHIFSLKIWQTHPSSSFATQVTPLLHTPISAGRIRWQLITPPHIHSVWNSSTLSSMMVWRLDRWRLARDPSIADNRLYRGYTVDLTAMASGNRYLFSGSDVSSFEVIMVSRSVIWMIVASIVLFLATIASSIPKHRHPMLAIGAAVLLSGLMTLAPDAAVMAGQVGFVSLVLVIVMMSIRALVQGEQSSVVPNPTSATAASKEAMAPVAGAPAVNDGLPVSLTTTAMQASPSASSQPMRRGF